MSQFFKQFVIILFLLFGFNFFIQNTYAQEYYDLSVEEIILTPFSPKVDESVTIKVKIRNTGTRIINSNAAFSTYNINFSNFSQTSFYYPQVSESNPLSPDEYTFYSIDGRFTKSGDKTLQFSVDKDNKLAESNESNNTFSTTFSIKVYDISLNEITIVPERPAVGQECVITITLKNTGNINLYNARGINSYEYNFPDFVLSKIATPGISLSNKLTPGSEIDFVVEGMFNRGGAKALEFEVDVANQMEEDNEENNTISKNIEVFSSTLADLRVESIEFSKDEPIVGEELEIKVIVKNTGSFSLVSDKGLLYDWFLDRDYVIEPDIKTNFYGFNISSETFSDYPTRESALDPGDTFKYTYIGRFSRAGLNHVGFVVDVNNRLDELNEENNATSTQIHVYQVATDRDDFNFIGDSLEIISSSSVKISWSTDQETTGKLSYKKLGRVGFDNHKVINNNSMNHVITIDDLYADTVYDYKIIAYNGTITKEILNKKFSVPRNNQIIITQGPLLDIKASSTNFTWKTNLMSDSYVFYKKSSEEYYTNNGVSANSMDHSVNLYLEPGEYQYYVLSSNVVFGTEVRSEIDSFFFGKIVTQPEIVDKKEADAENIKDQGLEPLQERYISEGKILKTNTNLYHNVKGRILLLVESHGEAWYINPVNDKKYYLGRPHDAFQIMRELGIGITNSNLEKIQKGDKYVQEFNRDKIDFNFAAKHSGKIFLQVESAGEAWYVNPSDLKRYYLGRPADAFGVMRDLSIGILNVDFMKLSGE